MNAPHDDDLPTNRGKPDLEPAFSEEDHALLASCFAAIVPAVEIEALTSAVRQRVAQRSRRVAVSRMLCLAAGVLIAVGGVVWVLHHRADDLADVGADLPAEQIANAGSSAQEQQGRKRGPLDWNDELGDDIVQVRWLADATEWIWRQPADDLQDLAVMRANALEEELEESAL